MRKFLLLMIALLAGVSGAMAASYSITYDTSNGTFYRNGAVSTDNWSSKWVSNESGKPVVTIETSVNNMNAANGRIAPQTYTITVEDGYIVTGFSMNCPTFSADITVTPAGESATSVSTGENIQLTSSASSFVFSATSGQGRIQAASSDGGSFVIYVEEVPFAPVTYVISDANGVVYTSDPINTQVGTTITTVPSSLQRAFCSYTVTPTEVATAGSTVPVTVTYSLPFTLSASFDDAVWYYATIRDTKYLRADDSHKDGSNRYQTNSTNEKTDVYKWAFFGNPYAGLYIANKGQGAGKYLYAGDVPTMQAVEAPATTTAALWAATTNSDGFTLRSLTGSTLYINDAGNGGNIGYWNSSWGATDAGSKWNVEEVPASEVTVTYNVVMGGQIVATASEKQAVGGAPAIPASLAYVYTTFTYDVQQILATTTTVTATPTFNMPFEASTDYDNAKWYYMQGHASYSDRYVSTNGTAVAFGSGNAMTDAYQWAFIGNPIEGIKIINKATGAGYYVDGTNPVSMSNTNAKVWTLKQQTNTSWYSGANGFGFYDSALTYMNCRTSDIQYWSQFDQGSTFWVEEVPDNYAPYVEAEIKPWFDSYGSYFQLKSSVVDANWNKYTAALTMCDLATYNELSDLVADPTNYVYPTTGYYRIKSAGARAVGESYIAYGKSNGSSYYGLITKAATAANKDASTVFYITQLANGKYTLSVEGLNVQAATQSTIVKATSDDAPEYSFIPVAPGYAAMTVGGGTYEFLHESGWTEGGYDYNAVLGWTAGAGASHWALEDATNITLSLNAFDAESYATTYLPFGVTLGGDVKAYALTYNDPKTSVIPTLYGQDGQAVPAGAPVLLCSNTGAASVTATIDNTVPTPDITNELRGSYFASTQDAYVLNANGGKLGFWLLESGATLAANKAYLPKSTGTNVKGFVLSFGDAVGINSVDNGQLTIDRGEIFNLAGQRVEKLQRGVNIVNGKKVIVK